MASPQTKKVAPYKSPSGAAGADTTTTTTTVELKLKLTGTVAQIQADYATIAALSLASQSAQLSY